MSPFYRIFAFFVLASLLWFQSSPGLAQAGKLHGAPLMQRYTAKDYNASAQHFSITTDKAGRLFVANLEGVLRFDGTAWELTELPGKQIARDITRAYDDKIYVASYDSFGELLTADNGKIHYQELLTLSGLQGKNRRIGNVWTVFETEQGVYFQAERALFFISYDRKTVKQWPLSEHVRSVFAQKNNLYARIHGLGFCKFVNEKFVLEPGGEVFAEQPLAGMVDKGSWRLLVSDVGFYRADEKGLELISIGASIPLNMSGAYEVYGLTDGSFVVGTNRGELLRFGKDLLVQERLKLGNFSITAINTDNEGGLWVATEGDLVRLSMPSPWSYVDATQGVQGIVYDFEWHENALWTASTSGIARIMPLSSGGSRYERLPWVNYEAYVLNSSENGLLVAHRVGLLVVDKGMQTPRVILQGLDSTITQLEPSRFDKTIIYALGNYDLFVLSNNTGQWQIKQKIPLEEVGSDSLVELASGEIWISDNYSGPQRWRLDVRTHVLMEKKVFGKKEGLPINGEASQHLYRLDDKLHLVLGDAGYVFDGKRFKPDTAPPLTLMKRPHELYVAQTSGGSYAYTTREIWQRKKGEAEWQALRISTGSAAGYGTVRLNHDGVVRISTWGGILQYDDKQETVPLEPLLLSMEYVLAEKPDNKTPLALPTNSQTQTIEVPRGHNLRLRFSMVSLESGVEFRYRMLQLSSEWSAWSDRDLFIRAQTPGEYVLEVQAKTKAGREAGTLIYRYTVLPFWYEILWVRLLFLLAAIATLGGFIYWLIRRRVAQYRKDNIVLEKRISDRTLELESLNRQLSELATEDSLTGVANRRALENGLQREWYRCLDQRRPLSALMIDVDHFKQFNDKHGHLEGDVLLRDIAQTLYKGHDPKRELLARFGGEEFALLLPSVNLEEAVRRADMIRKSVNAFNQHITVSVGVAGFVPSVQIEQSSLLRRADAALYRAKRAGRNRVEFDQD